MKKFESIIWGVVLIIVGVILGLNAAGITNFDIFFNGWWTLFIIIPSFISVIVDNDKLGGLVGVIIGSLLLLACNDVLDFETIWKFALPVIIILIGIKLICGNIFSKYKVPVDNTITEDNKYYVAFSGKDLNYSEKEFSGAELNATFGGIKLDLTNADIKDNSVIKVSAIFGGIDLIIPDNVNVIDKTNSFFGGVEDKHSKTKKEVTKDINVYITGSAIFGGVEVK